MGGAGEAGPIGPRAETSANEEARGGVSVSGKMGMGREGASERTGEH